MCEEGSACRRIFGNRSYFCCQVLRNSISNRKIFPCYFGSALRMSGVEGFLDGIVQFTEEPFFIRSSSEHGSIRSPVIRRG